MSWNIKTPGDYINGPLTVAGAALFNNSIGIGEAATNGIKLLTAVANGGFPATSGTLQSSGSIRVTASDTTGCLDIGTAGAVSWIQACRRTNLADNFALVLNPNGGNIGIGTTSPNSNANRSTLTLQGAWGGQIDINVGALNHAQFGTDNFSSGASCRIQSQDAICFRTSGANIGAFLNTNGAFSLQNAVTNANGTGIVFPGTQNASTNANTLDDYEEGSWTPSLTFTTPGTLSVSYADRNGSYTKVGRVVTARFQISVSPGNFVKGTANGQFQISGLPFAVGLAGTQYFDLAASLADQNSGSLVFATPSLSAIYFERLSVSGTRIVRDNGAITDSNFASTNAGWITMTAVITYTV